MIIFPAIDIIKGKPVRLFKGDFSTAEQVADDVLETADGFVKTGAQWVHMVDLDGSLQKKRANAKVFTEVAANTPLKVEVGGGIRTMQDIDYYRNNGIARVILGSVALKTPDLVAVGIDAKYGFVATEGWTEKSDINFIELAKRMEDMGVKTIIYTDISKDGTLSGPNLEQLCALNEAVSCDITASGGVTNIDDIISLRDNSLYGAICGKSIYKGTLNLAEAVEVCK